MVSLRRGPQLPVRSPRDLSPAVLAEITGDDTYGLGIGGRVAGHGAPYPAPVEPPTPAKFDEPLPFMPNGSLGDSHPAGR